MKNLSVQPLPWRKVGLAIIPGLWLLWVQSTSMIWEHADVGFVLTIIVAIALIWLSLSRERHLALWSWLVFGMLFWSGWRFIDWILRSRTTLLFVNYYRNMIRHEFSPATKNLIAYTIIIGLVVIGIGSTYWIYQQLKGRIPRPGWLLLGLLLAIVIITSLATSQADCFGLPELFSGIACRLQTVGQVWFVLLLLLIPTTIALRWVKEDGLTACLFVVAFEPAWIEILFNRLDKELPYYYFPIRFLDISTLRLYSSGEVIIRSIEIAIGVLIFLQFLNFMVIIPIGLLRARSVRTQWRWLIVLSLLTLIGMYLIRGLALNGTSLTDWFLFSLLVLELWLPLLITAILYLREAYPPAPTETRGWSNA